MRFLADELVSRSLVERLRTKGHDVLRAREEIPGEADERLLALALHDRRIVLTEDFDFGRLIFGLGLGLSSRGVVIVAMTRFAGPPDERAAIIAARIEELGESAVGHLTVIEPDGNRRRRF